MCEFQNENIPVDVIFTIGGKIVVDHARDLLHVNAASEQVRSNEDTRRSSTELPHDDLTLALVHVSVHGRHGEITRVHRLGQPVHLQIQ